MIFTLQRNIIYRGDDMNFKEIVIWSKKTRQQICKEANIPYSTLSDLINGNKDIYCVKVKTFQHLASALGLSMESMYFMLENMYYSEAYAKLVKTITIDNLSIECDIYLYETEYYIAFTYQNKIHHMELCRATKDNTLFLEDIARFTIENFEQNLFLEGEVIL